MNKLDKDYCNLLQDILDNGFKKQDRTGTGTISVFGRQIRHKMSDGFPLLTTKKMAWKTMVTELLWFLRGDTNIKYLVDNNCHIWDGDAYQAYIKRYNKGEYVGKTKLLENSKKNRILTEPFTIEEFIDKIKTDDEFAKKWGELGPIYGKQWRSWGRKNVTNYDLENVKSSDKVKVMDLIHNRGDYSKYDVKVTYQNNSIDQIQNLINDLKTNPDSRRLMVTAWNPADLEASVLPPCHYGFQVYTRELSLEERLCIADKFNPLIREDCLTKTHHTDETEELKLVYRHEFLDSLGPNVVPQRRAISLMFNMRSNDVPLGLPFNIASYALLLEIIGKIVNMVPDELIGNLGDCHIYLNQIEGVKEQIGRPYTPEERHELLKTAMGNFYQTAVDEQVPFGGGLSEYYESYKIPYHSREPFELPKLKLPKTDAFWKGFDVSLFGHLEPSDFKIDGYKSHSSIKMPLSN
jgi:thymidylate synthase